MTFFRSTGRLLKDLAAHMAFATSARWNRRWRVLSPDTIGISSEKARRFGRACRRITRLSTATSEKVAVTVTGAFLGVNRYRLEFTDADAFLFLMDLYETGSMRFAELDAWLRQHVVPQPA